MKINVVEDSPQKLEAIMSFLNKFYDSHDITVNLSFQSGLKSIRRDLSDIVILDMTLPTFDNKPGEREGRVRPLGGYDLMRKLKLKKVQTKVIVLTQLDSFGDGNETVGFKDVEDICKKEFSSMFVGMIRYKHSNDTWKNELKDLLNMVII